MEVLDSSEELCCVVLCKKEQLILARSTLMPKNPKWFFMTGARLKECSMPRG